jgi:two-component system, cell cycle sensor histidine kinase and response regulator CckA
MTIKKELSLRELTDALTLRDTIKRENEKNFQDIFFLNPIAMVITKMDGMIIKINEAFTGITGYTKDEVYGKTVMELGLYYNPEERKEILQILKEKRCMLHRLVSFVVKGDRVVPCVMSSKIIEIREEEHILSVIFDDTWRV